MNELSLADVAALNGSGNNGGGWGNGDGWWIILLFILLGGWGGNRGWGNNGGGAGLAGGNELYPWLAQQQNVNDGFRDQMLNTQLMGVQNNLQNGFANAAMQLCNCCNDMQVATLQGFNGLQAQTAQLASDIQLGNAQQTATILAENCADRAALSDGVRDIIASNTAQTQAIIDKLCQLELDGYKRENSQLQSQLNAANLAASQAAQNALIQQGFANEVDQLYNRLNTCPVPSMPVYGRTPIFTCQSQNGCGCGCN